MKIYKDVEFYNIYEKILDMEILFPFSDYEEYDIPSTKSIGGLSYLNLQYQLSKFLTVLKGGTFVWQHTNFVIHLTKLVCNDYLD